MASAVEGMADEPMIVPEGTEFDGDAPPAARQGPGGSNDDALAERLATRVAEHPKDVLAHLDYQLHQFISGRPVPELAALAPLPAEDREVVAAVMDGLGNFRSTVEAEPNALLSKRVRPLVQTGERLSGHAGLGVPAVRLCRKVDGFGAYVPIEPAQFTAGGDGRMLVYAEVQNFASELDADGHWQTRLRHAMTLYEETGKRVASAPDQAVTDASRSRRRDFYTVARYQLPATLPPGRYILKVRIRDEQSDQVAEAPVPLEVLGR